MNCDHCMKTISVVEDPQGFKYELPWTQKNLDTNYCSLDCAEKGDVYFKKIIDMLEEMYYSIRREYRIEMNDLMNNVKKVIKQVMEAVK